MTKKIQKEEINVTPDCRESFLLSDMLQLPPFRTARLREGGYSFQAPGFWIQRTGQRGFHVLVITFSGQGLIHFEDGSTIALTVGTAFFSAATGQGHVEIVDGQEKWEMLWMIFEESSPWIQTNCWDWEVFQLSRSDKIKEAIISIFHEETYKDPDSLRLQTIYEDLLLILLKREINWTEPKTIALNRSKFSTLWSSVSQNPGYNWNVDLLSEEVNISKAHFTRLCTQLYNQPPAQLLKEIRMDIATNLIRNSNLLISEIAEYVGYSSSATFSIAYRKFYGYPPYSIRQQKRENQK